MCRKFATLARNLDDGGGRRRGNGGARVEFAIRITIWVNKEFRIGNSGREAAMSEYRLEGGAIGTAPAGGRWRFRVGVAALASAWLATGACAETIGGALTKAYLNNPNINQQRAGVRAQDENIPISYSGYLPQVSANGSLGIQNEQIAGAPVGNGDYLSHPRGYGASFTENVWNGNKTFNSIRQRSREFSRNARRCGTPSSKCCWPP